MEKGEIKIELKPHNYFCLYCAMDGDLVNADILVWDDDEKKVYPLCRECEELKRNEENTFFGFGIN